MNISLKKLVLGALIAAMYAALTLIFAPISYGPVQFRIAEGLTILPFFTGASVPGLFVGCLVANLVAGNGIYDIIFGSLATLIAAFMTYKIKNRYLAPLPPVIVNAIIIGLMLSKLFELDIAFTMLTVGIGQLVTCYGIGLPLIFLLEKHKNQLFK